jgi:hypothetical protein
MYEYKDAQKWLRIRVFMLRIRNFYKNKRGIVMIYEQAKLI